MQQGGRTGSTHSAVPELAGKFADKWMGELGENPSLRSVAVKLTLRHVQVLILILIYYFNSVLVCMRYSSDEETRKQITIGACPLIALSSVCICITIMS